MKLSEAVEHLLNGNALLFIGSGFSVGAKDIEGNHLPSTRLFAERLIALAGLKAREPDLQQAARAYIKVRGPASLVDLVKATFCVGETSASQEALVALPWQRIYTTNYDNALEFASAKLKKPIIPVTTTARPEEQGSKPHLCVHINGYAPVVTTERLDSELKLTNTSYLTDTFAESTWSYLFRSDTKAARAVIFIGYSLYDLDLQRILFGDISLKSKCVFVIDTGADDLERSTLEDFGEVFPVGVDEFSSLVRERNATFVPTVEEPIFTCIEVVSQPPVSRPPRDIDVIDLLLQGLLRDDFVWRSLIDAAPSNFYIERTALSAVVEAVCDGGSDAVIHSDFANGKTLLVRGVALQALARGFRVYVLTNSGRTLPRELQTIARSTQPTILIVENYPRFESELRQFLLQATAQVRVVFTARTGEHELKVEWLARATGKRSPLEFDINQLDDTEIELFVSFLERFGLWGQHASKSHGERLRLVKGKYDGEIQKLLLDALHAPQVVARLNELLEGVKDQEDLSTAIIALGALSVLQYFPRISLVCELVDTPTIRRISFTRHPAIQRLMVLNGDVASIRSSVLGRHLLVDVFNGEQVIDVLLRMAHRAAEVKHLDPMMGDLFRDLQIFGNIQWMLPERNRRPLLIRYYENLKNTATSISNPFFWLQYAIARLSFEDFENAGRYFDNAYALAEKMVGFDAFHIDNHYARFLLENAVAKPDPSTAFEAFAKARNIVNRHLGRETRYYPYRVARRYEDFYIAFKSHLSESQRGEFYEACENVVQHAQQLKGSIRNHYYVRDAEQRLRKLLEQRT